MQRLRVQINTGSSRVESRSDYASASQWVDALTREDQRSKKTASPEGAAAFAVQSSTADGDGTVLLTLTGSIAKGTAKITIRRPIYGDFKTAAITQLCWTRATCEQTPG